MKSKAFTIITTVIFILFSVLATPVLAASPLAPPRITIDWAALLDTLVATYWPYVSLFLAAVIVDLGCGVGAALKTNTFQWAKLTDFYSKQVLPGLLGWFSLTIGLYLIMPHVLSGTLANTISQGTATAAWASIMATLAASIGKSVKELFGVNLPLPTMQTTSAKMTTSEFETMLRDVLIRQK